MYLQCFGRPLVWKMWVFTYSSLLLLSLLISFHQLVRGVLGLMASKGVLRERLNCPYLTRQEMANFAIRIVARSFAVTNRGWYVPRVEHNCVHASKFIFSQIFSPWLIGLGSAPAAKDDARPIHSLSNQSRTSDSCSENFEYCIKLSNYVGQSTVRITR